MHELIRNWVTSLEPAMEYVLAGLGAVLLDCIAGRTKLHVCMCL